MLASSATRLRIGMLLVTSLSARSIDAQGHSTIQPAQPRWGDTLSVSYDPPTGKSPRQVTAVAFLYFPTGGRTVAIRLDRNATQFRGTLVLPSELSNGALHFIADGTWDEPAAHAFVLRRPDGVLARGAHGAAMSLEPVGRRDSLLAESLRLYPDLIEVYRDRWLIGRITEEPRIESRIRSDLTRLAAQRDPREDAALYTRMSGLLLIGEFRDAWATLGQLVRTQPESRFTGQALQRYKFERLSVQGADSAQIAQVAHWTSALARRYPESALARENLLFYAGDSSWSLAAIDTIANLWTLEEPRNPLPSLYKAKARVARGIVDSADAMIRIAATRLIDGSLFDYGTLSAEVHRDRIREAFDVWARATLLKGDSTLALALAAAASGLHTPSEIPDPSLFAARLWAAAGQLRFAESDFVRASGAGAAMPAELHDIYSRTIDASDSFESYTDGVAHRAVQSATPRYLPAFEATTVGGTSAGSERLKGHVAVLNFWFTTCLPCLSEIPKLNSLMSRWAGTDVRFVAYALDDRPTVTRFLRDNPFRYQVVASASDVAERFGIDAYPLHVLIDRTGRIRMVVKGGEPTTLDRLRSGIATLLAEPSTATHQRSRDEP